MRDSGRRPLSRAPYRLLAFAAILCTLGTAAADAAGGRTQQLGLHVSPGVQAGNGDLFIANVTNVPASAKDLAVYQGTYAEPLPIPNQSCVAAPGDAWECSFTLRGAGASAAGSGTIFALSYPAGAFGGKAPPEGASPAVHVVAAAPSPPPLLWYLPVAFIVAALAGMRVRRQRLSRL